MPDTILRLGEEAFYMADLEKVQLSNSLEAIPDGCFNLCFLEEINLPSSIKIIGNNALRGLLFANEIDIPEGVEKMGYDIFEGIDRISLPSTLKEIAPDFYYEEGIDNPEYPPFITVHPDNKTFVSIDGSLYFKESGELATTCKYNGIKHFLGNQ